MTATSFGPTFRPAARAAQAAARARLGRHADTVDWPTIDRELVHQESRTAAATVVAGVPISVDTEAALFTRVQDAVSTRRPTVFVGLYAALYRSLARDARYRADVLDSCTYPDGFGVVRELQRRGRLDAQRLATTDMVHPVADLAQAHGWRVGLIGGRPGVAERAAARLRACRPELRIAAVWDGYDSRPGLEEVRAANLDLLLVGLGAGFQEGYAFDVAVPAGVPAVLTCGGLFDFLSGDVQRAPRWMQHHGLEWAFRVALEPRRMFVRYLLGNSHFLRVAGAERRRLQRVARRHAVLATPASNDHTSSDQTHAATAYGVRESIRG